MSATKEELVSRGVRLRCPNCGEKSLFPPGTFRIHDRCPGCGLVLNRGEGFFLGPMVVNYGIVAFVFIVPLIVLWADDMITGAWAAGLAITSCLVLPFALYKLSWSLWLMTYFLFLPDRLAMRGDAMEHEQRD